MSDTQHRRDRTRADAAWRLLYRVGFRLARVWWQVRRPEHEGAQVAIYLGQDLLLVRSSYRAEWNLPGGGIRRGESPHAAACRELAEEIGFKTSALHPVGVASGLWDGRKDRVYFFELRLEQLPELRCDNREIVEARLIPLEDAGQAMLTDSTRAYLAMAGPSSTAVRR
jgi:8-oxo-dGTP diphosphatase